MGLSKVEVNFLSSGMIFFLH